MRIVVAMIAALMALGASPAMADPTPGLYPASQTASVTEGATDTTIAFDAVTPTYDKPLFPDVQFDPAKLALVGPITLSAPNTDHATFKTVANLPGGVTTGTITFRMCRDSPCAHPWATTEQIFTYTINVTLKDWVTHQRDAGHSGYVHASYAGTIKHRWVWQPAGVSIMSGVVTKGSSIFLLSDTNLVSLSMLGAPRWVTPTGFIGQTAPAIWGDKVIVPVANPASTTNPILVFDQETGAVVPSTMTRTAQPGAAYPPTPYGDSLYVTAGYSANVVTAYDPATGAHRWDSNGLGTSAYSSETPAVDSQYVYSYASEYLDVFDRLTGTRVNSIRDPYYINIGNAYAGAPMLGTGGNVVAFSGASSCVECMRPLVKFKPNGDAQKLGNTDYFGTPAIANGVVYTGNGLGLYALSEANGSVLWSWGSPPDDQTPVTGNIIATDTLIFVSTEVRLYAISATDPAHPTVWSALTPGDIAISKDNLLLVTTNLNGSPTLVAYSIK